MKTPEEKEDFKKVASWVRKWAKTDFMYRSKMWNSRVTCIMDFQQFSNTSENSLILLIDRIYAFKEARNYILNLNL